MTWFRFRVPMRQLSLGDTVIEMDGNDGNIGLGDSWGPTNAFRLAASSTSRRGRGTRHAEGAVAKARRKNHAEFVEYTEPWRGVLGRSRSVGNPWYPCHPCETIAPMAGVAASV